MASPTYTKLLGIVTPYIDQATAEGTIKRQLGTATPESLTSADLKACANKISIALKLYVADATKREELATKLKALAA
jgi:hypothetical protein